MIFEFDEARLDDRAVLDEYDDQLRHLAGAGARIRIEAADARLPDDALIEPRGVVVTGPEARLLRAVMEPVCPVPLVAWSLPGLPGWAGPLDLVVVLGSEPDGDHNPALLATLSEATRRGCLVLLVAPADSQLATVGGKRVLLVPTRSGDVTAAAVVALGLLHDAGLGPVVITENAAEAADMVAEQSSPHKDLSLNPAKDFACALGDAEPLIWGGSVLAARASRRIAEAVRFYSGRHALAADADEIAQVLTYVTPRDVFADPFTEEGAARRPVLVVLDDEHSGPAGADQGRRLRDLAQRGGVRVCELNAGTGSEIDRYITLLMQGLYGATYLGVGLGWAQ